MKIESFSPAAKPLTKVQYDVVYRAELCAGDFVSIYSEYEGERFLNEGYLVGVRSIESFEYSRRVRIDLLGYKRTPESEDEYIRVDTIVAMV